MDSKQLLHGFSPWHCLEMVVVDRMWHQSQVFPGSMASSVRWGNNYVDVDRVVVKLKDFRLSHEGMALNCNSLRTGSNMVLAEGVPQGAHVRENYYGSIRRKTNTDEYSKRRDRFEFEEDPLIRRQKDRDKYWVSAEIPSFSGIFLDVEDFIDWVKEVEKFFDLMEIPQDKMVKLVKRELRGGAAVWWDEMQRKRARQEKLPIQSWRRMKQLLMDRFLPLGYKNHLFRLYYTCLQGKRSVNKYTKEFVRLADLNNLQESEEITISRYLIGLNASIRDRMRNLEFYTLEGARQWAEFFERVDQDRVNLQMIRSRSQQYFGRDNIEVPVESVGMVEDEEVELSACEVIEVIDESKGDIIEAEENIIEVEEELINSVKENVIELEDGVDEIDEGVEEKLEEEYEGAKFIQDEIAQEKKKQVKSVEVKVDGKHGQSKVLNEGKYVLVFLRKDRIQISTYYKFKPKKYELSFPHIWESQRRLKYRFGMHFIKMIIFLLTYARGRAFSKKGRLMKNKIKDFWNISCDFISWAGDRFYLKKNDKMNYNQDDEREQQVHVFLDSV